MDTKELNVKVISIESRMQDLMTAAKKEKRELTAEEGVKYDALVEERAGVRKNIDRCLALKGETRTLNPNAQIDPSDDITGGNNPLDVPEKDLRNYSVMRAIRCLANKKPLDGLEGEISDEIAKRSGKQAQGFYLYGSAMSAVESRAARQILEKRDLTLTTGVGGINQTVLFQSFIDKLRHRTTIDRVGARFMAGLVGNFFLPRQSGVGQAYWVGEEGSPTASNQTIDQVALSAKTVGAYTDISREFIRQTSLDAEAFVRDDLTKIMAIEIDRVSFAGDGTSNSPTGILRNTSITHTERSTYGGSALSWADVVGMEGALAQADADLGALSYVTNNKVRALLKTTLKSSVAGATYIWDENEINGYPAFASNNIPVNNGPADTEGSGTLSSIIFGNFSDLIVAMWGGLDLLVDPYTNSKAGTVRIVALQDIDIKVRHNESFQTIDDVLA